MMDTSNLKEFYVNRKRNRKLKRFAMLGLVLLLIIINLIVVPKITGEDVKYEDDPFPFVVAYPPNKSATS